MIGSDCMSVFESITKGLQEAIDYEKGKENGVRRKLIKISPLPHYQGNDVKNIRNGLNLSQASFAELMGVSIKTVEAWESGRNIPQGPAQRMLELLENEADLVNK